MPLRFCGCGRRFLHLVVQMLTQYIENLVASSAVFKAAADK